MNVWEMDESERVVLGVIRGFEGPITFYAVNGGCYLDVVDALAAADLLEKKVECVEIAPSSVVAVDLARKTAQLELALEHAE